VRPSEPENRYQCIATGSRTETFFALGADTRAGGTVAAMARDSEQAKAIGNLCATICKSCGVVHRTIIFTFCSCKQEVAQWLHATMQALHASRQALNFAQSLNISKVVGQVSWLRTRVPMCRH